MSVRVVTRERLSAREPERVSSSRAAARLVAAALTTLLVSFIVVSRSADALSTRTESPSRFKSGQVALTDDDDGRILFNLPAMAPGRVEENCITVSYQGAAYPASVRLSAAPTGTLAKHLNMKVEQGTGGEFGNCAGFEPSQQLFDGTLQGFGDRYGANRSALTVFTAESPGDARTFRFRFALGDGASTGGQANATFQWEANLR